MDEVFFKLRDLSLEDTGDFYYLEKFYPILTLMLSKMNKEEVYKMIEKDVNICCYLPEKFLTKEEAINYLDKGSFHMKEFINDYDFMLKALTNNLYLIHELKQSELRNNIEFIKDLVSRLQINDHYDYAQECPLYNLIYWIKNTKENYQVLIDKIKDKKITLTNGIHIDYSSYSPDFDNINDYLKYYNDKWLEE